VAAAASGGVIVFPTDTFYGLGADPSSPGGLAKTYELKGRPPDRTLLILVDDFETVGRFAAAVPATHRRLMDRYWPGPLSLLFPARDGLAPETVSHAGQVALRLPGSALCRDVLRAAGGALTGTSANRSGDPPCRTVREIARSVTKGADLIVDGGTLPPAEVSTLLSVDGDEVRILRDGALKLREIEDFLSAGRG